MDDIYESHLDATNFLLNFDIESLEVDFRTLYEQLIAGRNAVSCYREKLQSLAIDKQNLEMEVTAEKEHIVGLKSQLSLAQTTLRNLDGELVKVREQTTKQEVKLLLGEKEIDLFKTLMKYFQEKNIQLLNKINVHKKELSELQNFKASVLPQFNKIQNLIVKQDREIKTFQTDAELLLQQGNKIKTELQELGSIRKHSSSVQEEYNQQFLLFENEIAGLKALNEQMEMDQRQEQDAGESTRSILESKISLLQSVCHELDSKYEAEVNSQAMTFEKLKTSISNQEKLTKQLSELNAKSEQQKAEIHSLQEKIRNHEANKKLENRNLSVQEENDMHNVTSTSTET